MLATAGALGRVDLDFRALRRGPHLARVALVDQVFAEPLAQIAAHFKLQRPHLEMVARLELTLRRDAFVVHVGAVLAAKIADGNVLTLHNNGAVVAADDVAAGPKLAFLRPADVELGSRDL